MPQTTADLLVPLNHFSPSPTNPARRLTSANISNLADSIASYGVMQPIVARRLPGAAAGQPPLEIVAGHRRWWACRVLAQAGRSPHGEHIPALEFELTDAQVLAMQLVENIHRDDLHPLEEAAHYQRMRDDPAAPASVDDIANVGKVSVSRVYERLSLLHLVPAACEAFMADKLSLKTAVQVARLPAQLQAEVTLHLADWGGEPMAPKAAAAFIKGRYMLRLAQAPFDPADAHLVPDAGSCGVCPKRTGANPQLFGDIAEDDTCTDTTCFASKKTAQHGRLVDELRVSGFTVVQGDQARDACTSDGRALKPGLHALEAAVPRDLGDPALKIVDVLTHANAPNEHTKVIDHPSNAVVIYAVGTVELEQHLRKLKVHRVQLDKAKALEQRAALPTPAPAGAPAPQQTGASLGAAVGAAEQAAALSGTAREAFDAQVQRMLAFDPPPTSGGKYGHLSPVAYAEEQLRRAKGILAGAEAAWAMRHDRSEGLPQHRMAHMLLVLLLYGDSYLGLVDACNLAGVDAPDHVGAVRGLDRDLNWAWALEDHQAERLALVLLAAQDHDGKTSPLRYFADTVCDGLGVPTTAIDDQAGPFVDNRLRLGALQHGDDPKKPAAVATEGAPQ